MANTTKTIHVNAGPPPRRGEEDIAPSADATVDRLLLERFVADRDEAAFAGLVQRHGRCVWGVCRRFLPRDQDAEDAFQAVFLILARKAASIRKGESVGSWLYGVAYRLSLKAKQSSLRRQEREKQVKPATSSDSPVGEAACRELQRVLDEEVMRLKDKYRDPFVLCCLEGMSKAEAAKELRCKEGTVSGRLARARAILKTRLARRGFTLSAALTAIALAAHSASAAAPAALVQATPAAVLAYEVGTAALPETTVTLANALMRPARAATGFLGVFTVLVALFLFIGAAGVATIMLSMSYAKDAAAVVEPETFLPPGTPLGTPVGEQVLAVAMSPDGGKLVTAGAWGNIPGQLKVWDTETSKEIASLTRIPGVRSAAFSPDGKSFVTGDFSGALTLRDPETADEFASVKAHGGGVNSVAYSRDGLLVASGGLDRMAKLWNSTNLRELKSFAGHTDSVLSVAMFGDGKSIVTGSRDGTAKIWDAETGKEKFTLKGHRAAVESVAVSRDDKIIVTASPDQTVRMWNADTGEEMAILDADQNQPYLSTAFSTDGSILAAAGMNGTVQLWDTKTWQSLGTLSKHKDAIWSLAFAREGLLVTGSADKTAKLWNTKGGKRPRTITTSWAHDRPIRAAVYAPEGQALAVATPDKSVYIRDTNKGDVITVLHGHAAPVNCLAFSPNSRLLASGADDGVVKLWTWTTGDELHTLAEHVGPVHALAFTPDGERLVTAGEDGSLRIWDAGSGRLISALPPQDAPLHSVAVSLDGKLIAGGNGKSVITLWDAKSEAQLRQLAGHAGPIRALAFSKDGSLASGADDMAVKLWDPSKGAERLTINGHTGEVLALAFSPGGKLLTSGGRDGTVRIWNAADGQARGTLKNHKDAVTALAMHPHGKNLVSGSMDTLLIRWQAGTFVPPEKKEANAERDRQPVVFVDPDVPMRELTTDLINKVAAAPDAPVAIVEPVARVGAPGQTRNVFVLNDTGVIANEARAEDGSRGWVAAVLIIGVCIVLLPITSLGVWFFVRRQTAV